MKILKKATILLLAGSMASGLLPGTAMAAEPLQQSFTFGESVDRNQSKLISLPTGAIVTDVTADTGTASIVKVGSQYQVNVSGGSSTGSSYNPYKYSQYVTDSRTSSSTSFANSIDYNSGGYTGALYKNGSAYQSSGSYTPADSNYVTAQRSSSYNSGGYSGTLSRYLYSGSYTSSDSKYVSGQRSSSYNSGGYSGTLSRYLYSGSYTASQSKSVSNILGLSDSGYCDTRMGDNWQRCEPKLNHPSKIYYSSDGYSGNISYQKYVYWQSPNRSSGNGHLKFDWTRKWYYSGTITKPAVDTRVYRYEGTVTKPAVDTRTYRYEGYVYRPESDTRRYTQNYAGTVYSGGSDPTYAYNVTIHYIVDSEAPTGKISFTPNEWTKEDVLIRVSDIVDVGEAGYESIRLPNGVVSTETNVEYLVKENGDYIFEVRDKGGNVGQLIAEVRNIDRSLPIIHFKETSRTTDKVLTNVRITEIGDIK